MDSDSLIKLNSVDELLRCTVEKNGSDLHLVAGTSPCIRINGELLPQQYPVLTPQKLQELLFGILNQEQQDKLKNNMELDFSYSIQGVARFRGNIMVQRGSYAAVFRAVPYVIPEFDKLGLPREIRQLCNLSRGLVLVTGPTGSGKSTTLASLIDILNSERKLNIVTVEDPIEFLKKPLMEEVCSSCRSVSIRSIFLSLS